MPVIQHADYLGSSYAKCAVGCDPEVFLIDPNTKRPVSSVGIVPGTKSQPFQLESLPEGCTVQQDNVAIEFGIPPCTDSEAWRVYLNSVKSAAKKQIVRGLSFSRDSAIIFPQDQLQTAEANTFGCEADYNAWTKEVNPKPEASDPRLRTAGGHVHIGTVKKVDPFVLARWCDVLLGLPSVLMDKGELRKEMYGKAGAMRVKPYGIEYRVLSNFWFLDDKYYDWVFNSARVAHAVTIFGKEKIDPVDARDIQKAIDTNDKALAKELCDYFGAIVL